MEINITQKFVDLIYDLIGSLKGGGIDQIDIKDPGTNAIVNNNTLTLIDNISSIRRMTNIIFANFNLDPDLEKQFLSENPFISNILNYYKNLPDQVTQKDILYTAQGISKEAILFSSFNPSKEDIYKFLISVSEFYLLDKKIEFNHLINDPAIIKEIKNSSWLFERSHDTIKNLFLSKVTNNVFLLDVNFLLLLAVSYPQYINEALTSLNLRFLERGSSTYSQSFENDLKKIKSIQASKNAKVKADKEATKKKPIFQKLEAIWDDGEWSKKGRGKYTEFAKYIIYNDEIEGIEFDAIRSYASKYDKSKSEKC